MKKYTYLLIIIYLFSGCNPEETTVAPQSNQGPVLVQKEILTDVPTGDPYTQKEIDKYMHDKVQTTGEFSWENSDLKILTSAAMITKIVAIGYQPAGTKDLRSDLHRTNIKSKEWIAVHDALIELVVTELKNAGEKNATAAEIISEDDNTLPIIVFKLTDKSILTKLYNLENVRYIEPFGYWPTTYINERVASSSGCSGSTQALNAADYTTISPGCKMSWNFNNVNVPSAWNIAQGLGITVGVIDAGISSSQTLLGSNFNNGESNVGRTLTTDYTYGSSAFTSCTHGTSMSGIVAGPRNNLGGPTGVAYKANLHFIRGCSDVVLNESAELSGVRNALVKMGNMVSLKIISMSIGTPFSSSTLLDGVSYASGKGKLLFAAAGTSFSWTSWWGVIYPANYSQCVAVTGVKENGNTCSDCHDGSQVDLTIPMARNTSSSRTTLSLPMSGYNPKYVGGSSCATALTAGVAALVWSVNPNLTATQVLTCMKGTAQFYPNLSSSKGYGNVNAYAAVMMASGM
jgi:serine protease